MSLALFQEEILEILGGVFLLVQTLIPGYTGRRAMKAMLALIVQISSRSWKFILA